MSAFSNTVSIPANYLLHADNMLLKRQCHSQSPSVAKAGIVLQVLLPKLLRVIDAACCMLAKAHQLFRFP